MPARRRSAEHTARRDEEIARSEVADRFRKKSRPRCSGAGGHRRSVCQARDAATSSLVSS
jgi:hypothetical protein